MGTILLCIDDIHNMESPHHQRIGDKRAVAAPWNSFGAHDGRTLFPAYLDKLMYAF